MFCIPVFWDKILPPDRQIIAMQNMLRAKNFQISSNIKVLVLFILEEENCLKIIFDFNNM